jgi:hypothetical protein
MISGGGVSDVHALCFDLGGGARVRTLFDHIQKTGAATRHTVEN